jgi:hypothetical protein
MASKQRADLQKAKEKKEKIILAALVGVLVIVGAFELPKMLEKSSPSSAGTAVQTTSTSPGVTSSGTAVSTPATVSSLPNPSTYKAGVGQLSGFSLFNGGDPFGNAPTASTTPSESTTSSTTTGSKTKSTTTTTTTPRGSYVAAKISVNGTSQAVLLKGVFPSASPAFVLNSVSAKQIEISVNGGSFASGQAKVTIKKGKSVVLVNTVDAMRYAIKFVAPLTSAQALSLISSTVTTGTTSSTTSTSTN